MSQPQRPRPHWRHRSEMQSNQAPPAPAPLTEEPPLAEEPWKKSWSNLQGHHLDRSQRHIAWQVLHGTLSCGALHAYRKIANRSQHQETIVSAVQNANCAFCEGELQTLTHMLLACPIAMQVWTWAANVWAAATTQPAPTISKILVLLDDRKGWNVSKEASSLWTDIRVIVLAGLHATSQQKSRGLPVSAYTAAGYVVHHLRKVITRDWERTDRVDDSVNVTTRLAQDICCTSWLRGRSPRLSLSSFMEKWGKTSALCSVTAGRLRMELSLQHPLAFSQSA